MKYNMRKTLMLGLSLTMTASLALAAAPAANTSTVYNSAMSTSFYSTYDGSDNQCMTFSQAMCVNDGHHTMGMTSFASSKGYAGNVAITLSQQTTSGDMTGNDQSTLSLILKDSSVWKGALNPDNKAKSASLTLDETSIWEVTGNSYVTILHDADHSLKNIHSNGYTIYYHPLENDNQWLSSKTFPLEGGGQLRPIIG